MAGQLGQTADEVVMKLNRLRTSEEHWRRAYLLRVRRGRDPDDLAPVWHDRTAYWEGVFRETLLWVRLQMRS